MSYPKIDVLLLNENDMLEAEVLNADKCVDTMEEVMKLLSSGDFLMGGDNGNAHGLMLLFPKKSKIEDFPVDDGKDKRFMAMPAYLGGRFHVAGQKWYGSNGNNRELGLPRSVLMFSLNDVETGAPKAYMSANLLSAMRTGAMPGLAAKWLAKKDSSTLALIGAGVVNRTCLMAFMAKFDIKTIKIKGSSMTSKSALELQDFIKKEYPQVEEIKLCETLEECLKDADIVSEAVSCKHGEHPVLDGACIKPGAVVISSGSMRFSHEYTIKYTKVLDNIKMYRKYQEELPRKDDKGNKIIYGCAGLTMVDLCDEGAIEEKDIRSIGDIIRGIAPGRTSDDEIFFVGVGGMPILDIGWGYECYKKAIEKGVGTQWNLWDKPYLS